MKLILSIQAWMNQWKAWSERHKKLFNGIVIVGAIAILIEVIIIGILAVKLKDERDYWRNLYLSADSITYYYTNQSK